MFQTNFIMEHEITYMYNTKEVIVSVAWENIVSYHGSATT